jgi:uncharacterized protein (DUF427 family)
MAHDARDSAAHGYPQPLSRAGQVEPVPRRIRAALDGRTVLDTTRALYLWEWPFYPRYLIPADDVDAATLVDEGRRHRVSRGTVARVGLRVGESYRAGAGRRYEASPLEALVGMIAFDWDALDAWYEEDERVFVHPRNPYVRVDALRSSRRVRVEKDGVVLAESAATVMVFETGLPTRYYFDRTAVDFSHLVASETVTACPYKGRTSAYWSVRAGGTEYPDLAWCYDFPTGQLRPIAGLVAFYDERVDVFIDGVEQPQPTTHFFDADSR